MGTIEGFIVVILLLYSCTIGVRSWYDGGTIVSIFMSDSFLFVYFGTILWLLT